MVGFDGFGTLKKAGRWIVVASIAGMSYRWEAEIEGIKQAYATSRKRSKKKLTDHRAERIAWRAIHFSVEAQCKNIRCGATDIAQEFGALLLTGNDSTIADNIKNATANGTLVTSDVLRLTT